MTTSEYVGPERRNTMLQDEVRELREATATLSHRVEALSVNFQKVNELTAQQQEVDRRASEAVLEAAKAVAAVRQVEESTIPRDELERKERERNAAIQAARRETAARATAIGVVIFALLLAGVLAATNYASGYKGSIYRVCVARSDQATKVRDYLEQQRSVAKANAKTDAERAQVDSSIAQLEAAFPIVDCKGLR